MDDLLIDVLSETGLARWVIGSPFIWPTLESIHFASLCVLAGSILVIDLRLIGFFRTPCENLVTQLIRLACIAFFVNLITGLLFFTGNTIKYVGNPAFELKMVMILFAGFNAIYYKLRLSNIVTGTSVTWNSRLVGYLSLVLWTGVIICGRMITFYAY